MNRRKVIAHIASSVDGYIARLDGDLDWLTRRPAPEGFYGMNDFFRTIDTTVMGRKTFDVSVGLGAKFDRGRKTYVFSRHAPPQSVPAGVNFVDEPLAAFVQHLRAIDGKNIWLMGGGEIISSFLDEKVLDEFIISVVPTMIGDGIPLIARRHRDLALQLNSAQSFPDGVVQLHYVVPQ